MHLHLHYEAVKHGWRAILDVIYTITQVQSIIINPSLPLHAPAFFSEVHLKSVFKLH